MTFVLYFYAIYDENTGTVHDHKHITLKLFPFQLLKGAYSYLFTTGIFTRVGYLRINKFNLP